MTTSTEQAARSRRPPFTERHPWVLGAIGLLLVAAAIVLQVVGIVQASGGDWQLGTLLAWLAIGVSVVAFVIGLVSVIRRRAWQLGVVVLIAALVANPFLLARLFDLFG